MASAPGSPAAPVQLQQLRLYKVDLLTGEADWHRWRTLQVQALRALGVYDHVKSDTSAAPPPASDVAAFAQWQHRDNAACSQIMFHIAADQQRNADNDDNDKTARQVWVKLHDVYTNTSLAAQMALRAQLGSLTQQPSVSIQDHSNQLLQLVDRLKACGETLSDKQLCGYFLSSLSAPYAAAVDMFKMMPTERSPTYREALKAFLSKETELKQKASETARSASVIAAHMASISSATDSSTVQLNLTHGGQKRSRSDVQPPNVKHCTHCDKRYHDESECWLLHPELQQPAMQLKADKRAAREAAAKRQKQLKEAQGNTPLTPPALRYTSANPTARTMTVHVLRGPTVADVRPVVTIHSEVSPVDTSPAMTTVADVNPATIRKEVSPVDTISTMMSATRVHQRTTPVTATGHGSEWYLDSGASYHVCGQRELLTTYQSTVAEPVLAAGDETMYAIGVGNVCAWLCSSPGGGMDSRIAVTLRDVLFVPDLRSNLISVTSLLKTGNRVMFAAGAAQLQDAKGLTWATASLRAGATLFSFWTYPRQDESPHDGLTSVGQLLPLRVSDSASMVELWHQRLNHLSLQPMLRLRRENLADGAVDLPLASHLSQSRLPCDACAAGKSHRQAVLRTAGHRASRCLELVHSDICGPIHTEAHGGVTGFLTFVDDCSRFVVVYLMLGKSGAEVLADLEDYLAWAENVTGQRLTTIRTDGGGEFINNAADLFLRQRGISRQMSTAYTSSQNGVAERINRTLMDAVRSMLHHANLSDYFWPLAVQAAVYVRNCCPTTAVQAMTPHQAWSGRRPDIRQLRVFGCICHVHVPEQSADRVNKLSARSVLCIHVGYSHRSKAYHLFNPQTRRLLTSKDVTFEESRFIDVGSPLARRRVGEGETSVVVPDATAAPATPSAQPTSVPLSSVNDDADLDEPAASEGDMELIEAGLADPVGELDGMNSDNEDLDPSYNDSDDRLPHPLNADDDDDARDHLPLSTWMVPNWTSSVARPSNVRRSQRGGGFPSSRALDAAAAARRMRHIHLVQVRDSTGADNDDEPRTYAEAMSRPDAAMWRVAVDSELDSLRRAGTWTLTPLPADRHAIGCKWVFKIKRQADGSIDKYKARLVAKGYSQQPGIDYDETFAPVAKFTSIRMLLALAAHYDFEVHQMDVRSAFLNGDLDVDIYMQQPEGYTDDRSGGQLLVCKLNKALYGLKQAGRAWFEKMDKALVQLGFSSLTHDSCIYVQRGVNHIIFITLYVDDLLILSSTLSHLVDLKRRLSQCFEMTDLGEAHFILGLQLTRNRRLRELSLSQQHYVRRVVDRYGMANCNPAPTPLSLGTFLSKKDSPPTPPAVPVTIKGHTYASVVGALMYAMMGTRPDLAYSVGYLSRFSSNPGLAHVTALKHVLRYLAGTSDYQLVYGTSQRNESSPSRPFQVYGYCDSDYAACVDDRLSVAGWVFLAAGGATSWQSQKQKSIALSTVEAEYMAACAACKEAVWQTAVWGQAGLSSDDPMVILSDSQGAMALAKNPEHHARSKHIDVRYHYVRRVVADGAVRLEYVASADQAADQLTKPLSKPQHDRCLAAMGIRSAHAPADSPLHLHTLRS